MGTGPGALLVAAGIVGVLVVCDDDRAARGDLIAYSCKEPKRSTWSTDGSGERFVLAHEHFADGPGSLAWSPVGRTIAVATLPSSECTAIHLVDVASACVRPLTSCAKKRDSALTPSWQPARR